MKKLAYVFVVIFWLLASCVFSQVDTIPPPPCGITNLQGEISCFPWSPNQGELSVNWEAPPGCQPV